jgi:ubiquinone biosynthesis protein
MSSPWTLNSNALCELVPEEYARFRPLLLDGIRLFLSRLSPQRAESIAPPDVNEPAPLWLGRLLLASPVLHKLGQLLARDRRLNSELRQQLQQLEMLAPHTPMDQLRPALTSALAPFSCAFRIELGADLLAEGSVAVVVPLNWRDPADVPAAPPKRGVVKLLKPGVRERLEEDLGILERLAVQVQERAGDFGLEAVAIRDTFDEVTDLLRNEIRLDLEQAHLRTAAEQFGESADVMVPRLLPFACDSFVAMERVDGRRVTDIKVSEFRRRQMFGAIASRLLADVIFSEAPATLFHGDPHAGNLLADDTGRVFVLDWALAGNLTRDDRRNAARLLVGAMWLDAPGICNAIDDMAAAPPPEAPLRATVDHELVRLFRPGLPNVSWMVQLLDRLALAGVRFPSRLLMFRKSYHMLQGVLGDLCAQRSTDEVLLGRAAHAVACDWPMQWLRPADRPSHSSHVSRSDLLSIATAAPAALLRFWTFQCEKSFALRPGQ